MNALLSFYQNCSVICLIHKWIVVTKSGLSYFDQNTLLLRFRWQVTEQILPVYTLAESTLFVRLAVHLLIAWSVVLEHWVLELSSAESIHAFLLLRTDSRGCIATHFVVEINVGYFVRTGLAWTLVIEEFPVLFVESTDFLLACQLFVACSKQFLAALFLLKFEVQRST